MSSKEGASKGGFYRNLNIKHVSCGILIGIVGFFLIQQIVFSSSKCESGLKMVRPVDNCDKLDEKTESFIDLEKSVDQMITAYTNSGQVTRVGVFARDLKTTRFFGINENQEFVMASLLKVPLAIAVYKLAEVEPSILDVQLVYTEKNNRYSEQQFQVQDKMIAGNAYPVGELIGRAIVYSDNSASHMLSGFYAPGFFSKILSALSLSIVREKGSEETIVTAKTFANVFRSLYNSSYLTREYSNYILDLLSKTTYKNGAMSKIPSDVKMAHKFAERSFFSPEDRSFKNPILRQLHECGIVYANNMKDPYSFCILTEGKNYADLEKVQAEISYKIYSALSR